MLQYMSSATVDILRVNILYENSLSTKKVAFLFMNHKTSNGNIYFFKKVDIS